jgi:hypothetical protein
MTSVSPTTVWVTPHKMFLTKEKNWNPVLEAELFGDPLLLAECSNACFALERYNGMLGSVRCTFRVVVRPNHVGSSATKFAESYTLGDLQGVWRWCLDAFDAICRDAERDHELQIKLSAIADPGWDRKAILAVAKERVAAHFELLRATEASVKKSARNSSATVAYVPSSNSSSSRSRNSSAGALVESDSFDSAGDDSDDVCESPARAAAESAAAAAPAPGALLRNDAVKRKLLKAGGPSDDAKADKDVAGDKSSSKSGDKAAKASAGRRPQAPAPSPNSGTPIDRLRALVRFTLDCMHEPFPSREQRTVKMGVYACSVLTLVMILSRATSFDFFMLLYVALMYLTIEVVKNRRSLMVKLYKRKVARSHRLIGHRLKMWIKRRPRGAGEAAASGAASSTVVAAELDDAVGELAELDEEEIVNALIANELE